MLNNRLNISVGVASYNAERNIARLLKEILSQQADGFVLLEILVHVDKGSDRTGEIARSVGDSRVRVVEAVERQGFAGSVKRLIAECKGDVLVLFNDDIQIFDRFLLGKIARYFAPGHETAFACGNQQPMKSRNFVESMSEVGFRWFYDIRKSLPNGGDLLSVDGKILALNKKFMQELSFPVNLSKTGNMDSFLYFQCVHLKLKFKWMPDVVAWYRNPSSFKDFLKWNIRNHSGRYVMAREFGLGVLGRYAVPWRLKLFYFFKYLLKKPVQVLVLSLVGEYMIWVAKKRAVTFTSYWEPVSTSKNL